MGVDRLARLAKGASRSSSGRLTFDQVPAGAQAVSLGTISGGDEHHSVSVWWIPGVGRRELTVDRVKLAKVLADAVPWQPPERTSLF